MNRVASLDFFLTEGPQEKKRFQEVIQEIICEYEEDASTDWDDYNPFQRAVYLGQTDEYKRLVAEGELGDFKENTISLFTMISFLARRGDYSTALFLIKKMSLEDQLEILSILGEEHFVFLDFVWGDLPEGLQSDLLFYFKKTPDVGIALFQKSTNCVQKRVFLVALMQQDMGSYSLSLWQNMNFSVKESFILYTNEVDFSVLEIAIVLNYRELILAMLEEIPSVVYSISNKGITSLELAISVEERLGREILEKIREKDAGFTEEITTCELCWHMLEFDGGIFDRGPDKSLTHLVPQMVIEGLKGAGERYTNLIEVLECSEKDPNLLAARALHRPILIDSSWRGHTTRWLILPYRDELICVKIDTGVSEFLGMSFYKIHNKDGLEEAIAISQRQENYPCGVSYCFLNGALDEILCLEYTCHIWNAQIGNSCCISSLNGAIDTLLYMDELTKQGLDFNLENLKTCIENSQIERGFCGFFRMSYFCNKAIPIMQKYAENPLIRAALEQVIEKYQALIKHLYRS